MWYDQTQHEKRENREICQVIPRMRQKMSIAWVWNNQQGYLMFFVLFLAIVNSVAGFGVGYFGVILWDKEQKQKDLVTPVTVDDGSGGQGGNHGNQVGYYQNPAPDSNVQNMYVGNGHTITNSSHSGKGIGGGNSKGFGYSTLIGERNMASLF